MVWRSRTKIGTFIPGPGRRTPPQAWRRGARPQTFRTTIVSTNPASGTTGVPVNAAVSIQTDAPVDPTSLVYNNASFSLYDGTTGQYQPGTYSQSPDGLKTYLAPAALLAVNRT